MDRIITHRISDGNNNQLFYGTFKNKVNVENCLLHTCHLMWDCPICKKPEQALKEKNNG